MSFTTNVTSDEIMDGLKSAFQTDKRIWIFAWHKADDGNIIITIEAEFESEEMIAKFNSVGYKATFCT